MADKDPGKKDPKLDWKSLDAMIKKVVAYGRPKGRP